MNDGLNVLEMHQWRIGTHIGGKRSLGVSMMGTAVDAGIMKHRHWMTESLSALLKTRRPAGLGLSHRIGCIAAFG